ncbi:MAG: hypothetical protein P9X24_02175 [Candidatus Hatepunaea meridiana]|nr:hypothetical protein [Candidatus Hatepunaea meridiana]
MKPVNSGLAILFVLVLVIALPSDSRSGWLLDDGGEDIILCRIDNDDSDAPLHEIDEGKYGYWADSETFILVINFNSKPGILSPFTWDDVKWVPGPMDKDLSNISLLENTEEISNNGHRNDH